MTLDVALVGWLLYSHILPIRGLGESFRHLVSPSTSFLGVFKFPVNGFLTPRMGSLQVFLSFFFFVAIVNRTVSLVSFSISVMGVLRDC